MSDRSSPTPFTFYLHALGTDGAFRAVGKTAAAARATLEAEAEPFAVDLDLTRGYTAVISVPPESAREMVMSLFVASHGRAYAEAAWAALNR